MDGLQTNIKKLIYTTKKENPLPWIKTGDKMKKTNDYIYYYLYFIVFFLKCKSKKRG